MNEALLKNRYGIPAALLIVLLLCGTALAWHGINTISTRTTVQEPLSTSDETEFSAEMSPGENNTWSFKIVNSADVEYTIKADLTYSAPDGVSITSFIVRNTDEDGKAAGYADETYDLTHDNSATFPYDIPANGTMTCSMKISAAKDATPGDVSVSLAISRG